MNHGWSWITLDVFLQRPLPRWNFTQIESANSVRVIDGQLARRLLHTWWIIITQQFQTKFTVEDGKFPEIWIRCCFQDFTPSLPRLTLPCFCQCGKKKRMPSQHSLPPYPPLVPWINVALEINRRGQESILHCTIAEKFPLHFNNYINFSCFTYFTRSTNQKPKLAQAPPNSKDLMSVSNVISEK